MDRQSSIQGLERVIQGRARREISLNRILAEQRNNYGDLENERLDALAKVENERNVLRSCQEKMKQMKSSSRTFYPPEMSRLVRYADSVVDRIRMFEHEVATVEQTMQACLQKITETTRTIRINHSKLDICSARVGQLKSEIREIFDNMADDDAEDLVVGRRTRTR